MKVREDYDLKKLKKLGFAYYDGDGIYFYYDGYDKLKVKSWNREVDFFLSSSASKPAMKFFKMIQDGIVEF